jgi:hypothetical protein
MNAFQSFEKAKAAMARDIAALSFEGHNVTGRNRLVSIDLFTGKLTARIAPDAKPFCYINLPTAIGSDTEELQKALMNPKLVALSFDAWDDLTSTLWAYTNIQLIEHPQSLEGIKLSPEAAKLFESRFHQ